MRNLLKGVGFSQGKLVFPWRLEWETDYLYTRATSWENSVRGRWGEIPSGECRGLCGARVLQGVVGGVLYRS